MTRTTLLVLSLSVAAVTWLVGGPGRDSVAEPPRDSLAWIWTDDASLSEAPSGSRFFRRAFTLEQPARKATLEITADNGFTAWVNGKGVGSGDQWEQGNRFDVTKLLQPGKNAIAVEGRNDGGPAGLVVRLTVVDDRKRRQTVVSDASWKAANEEATGWRKPEFDDSKWASAKLIAPYGDGPWGKPLDGSSGAARKERFTVPAGFRVETVVPGSARVPGFDHTGHNFSLVNMCFDARGRLLASQEGGPVILCVEPDKDGVFQKVVPYCTQVRNCQGMCWAHDSLYLVGEGPKGTGLYRCREAATGDRLDTVERVLAYHGGMGEHGPHAVVHGPDDKLYVVMGNHAWAQVDKLAANSPLTRWPTGRMGPDQGKPGTTEDVLLPRQNDANGHAANILAPGGTIWRLDPDGKNLALVAAGFRNHFDAAFNPAGELFTFDSDMEDDGGLPWYRAVRVCHCTPGADFVWRTGAANTPPYYIDSLPPVLDTGRGSPTGLEFYDHPAFPPAYRGAFFMCDWSIGVLWAVHLQRDGASYVGKAEKFCVGSPMPVTDCAVGPDGALYFTTGGRNTQGGIFRIVYDKPGKPKDGERVQPLAAWARARAEKTAAASLESLLKQSRSADPLARAAVAGELGLAGSLGAIAPDELKAALLTALRDEDPLVRRRACEALVRAGIEPPVGALRPLLESNDRFLATAARLVLQRIDPKQWAEALLSEGSERLALQAIVALCKTDRAAPFAGRVFDRLHQGSVGETPADVLDWLRTVQIALVHTKDRPGSVRGIALDCEHRFPDKDARVNRELAILLTEFGRTRELEPDQVVQRLLGALRGSDDRAQQIHYFYCLRLLHEGWTADQKTALLNWYEGTKTWTGGISFTRFLENILKDLAPAFSQDERTAVLAKADTMSLSALAFLRASTDTRWPLAQLQALYDLASKPNVVRAAELKSAVVEAFQRVNTPESRAALRAIARQDPSQRSGVVQALLPSLTEEDYPVIIDALAAGGQLRNSFDLIQALQRLGVKPKPDDPRPFRAVLLASRGLNDKQRWQVVELLRSWTGNRQFGADADAPTKELASWGRWYAQTFPKEPPLPGRAGEQAAGSKYPFADLAAYLDKDPRGKHGDPVKGKAVFAKASCVKCHKYGSEGEGIGPDLTAISKRFKRAEILESILFPSKVISDQYRSTRIETSDGRTYDGLASAVGDTVTVLLSDATKVTLKKGDIERQTASLISVMPERLLDNLTREEIADLFAYLESPVEPEKK